MKVDRRILLFFFLMVALSVTVPFIAFPFFEEATLVDVAARVLSGFVVSFLVVGILSFKHYRTNSLVPRRRLLRWLAILSVAGAALVGALLVIVLEVDPSLIEAGDTESPISDQLGLAVVAIILVLTPAFFVMGLVLLAVGFGIVGVMAALERRLTPWILSVIVGLSRKAKPTLAERAVRWLFDVPEVLDTSRLTIDPGERRAGVRWSDMKWAVVWQVFFGAILAVYVSFNPFISDRSPNSLIRIFSALTSGVSVLPLIILPWFIYSRIDARIKGQAKDFTLFNGIRARIFQSYVALGTLIILIRLSITQIEPEAYLAGFASFMVMLTGCALVCTFVYLNYFENSLIEDIAVQFRPPSSAKDGENPPA
jgi:hypothetical protein